MTNHRERCVTAPACWRLCPFVICHLSFVDSGLRKGGLRLPGCPTLELKALARPHGQLANLVRRPAHQERAEQALLLCRLLMWLARWPCRSALVPSQEQAKV